MLLDIILAQTCIASLGPDVVLAIGLDIDVL